MAFITKKELAEMGPKKLSATDYRALAEVTRIRKMKRWKSGYTAMQIRNFAVNRHTCSPEIKELILKAVEKVNICQPV